MLIAVGTTNVNRRIVVGSNDREKLNALKMSAVDKVSDELDTGAV
jgi:hypothetical protein